MAKVAQPTNASVAIVRCLELIEDGRRYSDRSLPAEIVDELELTLEGLERDLGPSFRCECGASFRWPGLLDHHRRFAHFEAAA